MNGRDRRFTNRATGEVADGTSVPFWSSQVPKGGTESVDGRAVGGGGATASVARYYPPRAQNCTLILL